jgi:trimeric autotransporter adhesin
MASSYVNDLRLNEMATGDASGTWGTTTNTNLELIAEAFSYGTEAITTNADTHTTTIADGATDPGRSMYLKYTGTLDSACTITIGPNTVSKVWIIENGTSGSQDIILSQGSGANITIPAGDTKVVYSDGAGAGAAFFDAFANVAIGTSSLGVNTTGGQNTGLGTNALGANTTASNNTAVGFNSLYANTTGSENTAVGKDALAANTTAASNSAFGYRALYTNTTGTLNTALGESALRVNTTANNNTAVGWSALEANTEGAENTSVGTISMQSNTTGGNNTALGYSALNSNVSASAVVAVGGYALTNSTGASNTACGYYAGQTTTSGTGNTMLGYYAHASSASASNQITLGGANVGELRCNVTSISALSDQRDKTDIVDSPYGLDFINTVRPVQFLWDTRDGNIKDGSTRIGFIAQELLTACDGNNDILDLIMDDNPDKLEAKYGNLLPIAIKAIQELSAQNAELTTRLEALEG